MTPVVSSLFVVVLKATGIQFTGIQSGRGDETYGSQSNVL